jgi:type IV pilus assembly protein PilV
MPHTTRIDGFTLIEVLVSIIVLAMGLIGLASLQATGVKNIQISYNRSQAVHLAQDIADRIRANKSAASTYADVDQNGIGDIQQSPLPGGTLVPICAQAAGCTPVQLAKNDIYQWTKALKAALPDGACGSVGRASASNTAVSNGCGGQIKAEINAKSTDTYIISINWDEDGDGEDPNFVLDFAL